MEIWGRSTPTPVCFANHRSTGVKEARRLSQAPFLYPREEEARRQGQAPSLYPREAGGEVASPKGETEWGDFRYPICPAREGDHAIRPAFASRQRRRTGGHGEATDLPLQALAGDVPSFDKLRAEGVRQSIGETDHTRHT
jgi:hypothetical protein